MYVRQNIHMGQALMQFGDYALRRSKSKTITRADLTDSIHREIGLSKPVSSQLVNSLISKIEDGLTTDGIVKLPGFGIL